MLKFKLIFTILLGVFTLTINAQTYPIKTKLNQDSVIIMTPEMLDDINVSLKEYDSSLKKQNKEKQAYKIALQHNYSINKGIESDSLKQEVINIVNQIKIVESDYKEIKPKWQDPETLFEQTEISQEIIKHLPKNYDDITYNDMREIAEEIDDKIKKLQLEKQELIRLKASDSEIRKKEEAIKSLSKEKTIVDLNIETDELKDENEKLESSKSNLKKIAITLSSIMLIIILISIVFIQRNKILFKDKNILEKNTFLNYAARLIRHDMHSGINTYIPRGMKLLESKLSKENIDELKIKTALQLIKQGLSHTQKVYIKVYEFTDMVKDNSQLNKKNININELLNENFDEVAYSDKIKIKGELGNIYVNPELFWFSLNTLIKTHLTNSKGNIIISKENNELIIKSDSDKFTKKFFNKLIQDNNQGIELRITNEIIKKHGFSILFDEKEKNKIKIILK